MAYPQSRPVVGVRENEAVTWAALEGFGSAGKSNWAAVSEEFYCSC